MNNKFTIDGKITRIVLERRTGTPLETVIDTADLDFVSKAADRWMGKKDISTGRYYVVGYRIGDCKKRFLLNRVLLNILPGIHGDHRNHDTLDNRRKNLRPTTNSMNGLNRKGPVAGSLSGHRGVSWNSESRQWIGKIAIDGKTHYLGRFDHKSHAMRAVTAFLRERGLIIRAPKPIREAA